MAFYLTRYPTIPENLLPKRRDPLKSPKAKRIPIDKLWSPRVWGGPARPRPNWDVNTLVLWLQPFEWIGDPEDGPRRNKGVGGRLRKLGLDPEVIDEAMAIEFDRRFPGR